MSGPVYPRAAAGFPGLAVLTARISYPVIKPTAIAAITFIPQRSISLQQKSLQLLTRYTEPFISLRRVTPTSDIDGGQFDSSYTNTLDGGQFGENNPSSLDAGGFA